MRRVTFWLLSTISTLVLLFSYHTSTSATSRAQTSIVAPQTSSDVAASGAGSTSTTGTGSAGTADGSTGSTSTTPSTAAAAATTVDGDVISTRYGNVQVQITVESGAITKSVVLQVPWNDHKDQEINSRAVPVLNSEVVAAQSSDIDMVSGATYTSRAYIQSLQSAIDQANL